MSRYPREPLSEEKLVASGYSALEIARVRLIESCDRAWDAAELEWMQSVWRAIA
jgi:hypothetical protein